MIDSVRGGRSRQKSQLLEVQELGYRCLEVSWDVAKGV
jgi:hypothetical protein